MDVLTEEKANAIKELKLDIASIKKVAGKEQIMFDSRINLTLFL
jgi:hypothetical protein